MLNSLKAILVIVLMSVGLNSFAKDVASTNSQETTDKTTGTNGWQ